ncbi:hypothetical protein BN12_4050004 [Nostocoides japonicum T1-X7]|uniref:Uncharacterized protein n=1 Tax=Nostocoides japonicum T1-X7 TaxID=1194083 RepID=A0A077M2F6_9MICO|nr:hypothetical protein [Tetrasphaera japonica]CCH79187.1 hypothetical protein BN12_4050004 [Tetrasphaera japonica T1-X7]
MFWTIALVAVAALLALCWAYDRRKKRRHARAEDRLAGSPRYGTEDPTGKDYGMWSPRGPSNSGGEGGNYIGG